MPLHFFILTSSHGNDVIVLPLLPTLRCLKMIFRLLELTAELENTRGQLQASQESTNSAIGGSLPKLTYLQAQVRA